MCLCDVFNNKFVDVDDNDFTFPPSLLVRILELEARCYFVSSATIANIIVVIIFNIGIKSNYEGGILVFFQVNIEMWPWHLMSKAIVHVFVFVCVSLSLSFRNSWSCSLSSPDDKVSENLWFVWSRISYRVHCHLDWD